MSDNFGPGIVGGVVLVDPVTGLPYKAEGGGGGGGAVDSVNGQTGVVVLDADDVGAVPSAEGQNYRVYGTDTSGINTTFLLEGLNPLPITVPMRTETGAVVTATPTANNHAATKQYVDDGTVPKYTGSSQLRAYASLNTSNQNIHIDSGTGGNTIAYRGAGGTLSVATPTASGHATTKQYVDLRVPVPPTTGTYTLQSVDGVTSWVAVTP